MKKLLSLSMAAAMLLSSAAIAHADTGTIPLYADELNLPAIKTIPTMYTEHKEDAYGRGTTTLWLSMAADAVTVMAYDSSVHYNVPVALDLVDGTTATYSTTGLKRQVGITRTGAAYTKYDKDVIFGKFKDDEVKDNIKKLVNKGWDEDELVADPIYEKVSDVLNFYVDVNGKATYVGYYDVSKCKTQEEREKTAENVINYLVTTEKYNEDALSWKHEVTEKKTGYSEIYILDNGTVVDPNKKKDKGDKAYYVTVGNQTSLHGRSGKVYEVAVAVDEDLFNTDMEFVSGTVTYKKTAKGAWYAATVTMNYSETSAVRSLKAEYLPTYDLGLQGYTVTINANGTTYVLDYSKWGGFEKADAYNDAGVYHSTGASAFDWANTVSWKYVRNFSLLSLGKLKSLFTRLY